jgi:glycosyltransferase involved in cell wall biosynthesis
MPIHNSEDTLHLAIASTLRALSPRDKLHVYFDDCTDRSRLIVESFRDARIDVVGHSRTRLGVRSALNNLLESVNTKFVSRMDADDVCFPWRFRIQRRLLSKAQFVFSTALIFGRTLKPLPVIPQIPSSLRGNLARAVLVFGNPYVHPTMSAHSETIFSLGGYTEEFAQDHGLWLRAAIGEKSILRDAFPTIAYRFHPNQFSSSLKWMQLRDADEVIAGLQSILELQLCEELKFSNRAELLNYIYRVNPLMKLEHKGLPDWLRRRKDVSRFRK